MNTKRKRREKKKARQLTFTTHDYKIRSNDFPNPSKKPARLFGPAGYFFAHKEKQCSTIYTQHNSSDRREDLRATAAAAAVAAIADALRSKSLW